ncbi:MAG: pentapeptide repeat-containing protein [Kurthia sp.]|nr:pentapeptide repeat-containing protein [Candidatus Kurthia equi]
MKLDKPRIGEGLEQRPFEDIFLEEDPELTYCIVCNAEFTSDVLHRARFSNMVMRNCSFIGSELEGIDVVDVRFENCDFSNTTMRKASIHRAEFINCKLLGADITEASLGNVQFEECNMNMSMFGNGKLERVYLTNTSLKSADFFAIKHKFLVFDQCKINDCNFQDVKLKGIDISTSEFDELTVTIELLKGCIVSNYQAIYFAQLLGLLIKD